MFGLILKNRNLPTELSNRDSDVSNKDLFLNHSNEDSDYNLSNNNSTTEDLCSTSPVEAIYKKEDNKYYQSEENKNEINKIIEPITEIKRVQVNRNVRKEIFRLKKLGYYTFEEQMENRERLLLRFSEFHHTWLASCPTLTQWRNWLLSYSPLSIISNPLSLNTYYERIIYDVYLRRWTQPPSENTVLSPRAPTTTIPTSYNRFLYLLSFCTLSHKKQEEFAYLAFRSRDELYYHDITICIPSYLLPHYYHSHSNYIIHKHDWHKMYQSSYILYHPLQYLFQQFNAVVNSHFKKASNSR